MIDWARVSELRAELGAEDFGEVIDLFLDEVETEISALKQSFDADMLESRLHFLKGSALNLGFDSFSKLCQEGETAAAQGAQHTVDVASVIASYQVSKSVFLNGLRKMTAG